MRQQRPRAPATASFTIRRLVLPHALPSLELGAAIAAATAAELAGNQPTPAPQPDLARLIARALTGHPAISATGLIQQGKSNGGR
jgi:hypothetical protein